MLIFFNTLLYEFEGIGMMILFLLNLLVDHLIAKDVNKGQKYLSVDKQ